MFQRVVSSQSQPMSLWRLTLLVGMIVTTILGVMSLPAIPQDVSYHYFADDREILHIPNMSDVASNAFFFLSGLLGLYRFSFFAGTPTVFRWRFFFTSIAFVSFGSAYYHWAPSNDSLVWDRLPMTLGFASLTVNLLTERFGERTGKVLFWPLLLFSAASVAYWWFTEELGAGDLRPYIVVQYLPLLLVPALLILFPKGSHWDRPYWLLLLGYTIAKGFEWQDAALYEWTYHIVSGHTLKHIAAAIAILVFRPYTGDLLTSKDQIS
jgi:hypothetical protein